MALVDGNYQFLYVDVGAEGRNADGGVWEKCSLRKAIDKEQLNIPIAAKLPNFERATPFVVIADDAFPMGKHLVKPYSRRQMNHSQRVFNYRLSRARRCAENAFGILATRFRIFLTEIHTSPENATDVVLAACCLHNLLRRKCGSSYIPPGSVDLEDANQHLIPGDWRQHERLLRFIKTRQRNASRFAKRIRSDLEEYFTSIPGSVPWQNRAIYAHE